MRLQIHGLTMTGRITRAIDFERVLKTPSQSRSPHFAVHHLPGGPSQSKKAAVQPVSAGLSTSEQTTVGVAVDELSANGDQGAILLRAWLGMVVPKRHARRAVTRNLLKRQMKAVMASYGSVPPGLWVIRLRSPFDRAVYVSAASHALSNVARKELESALADACRRVLAARGGHSGLPH